MAIEPKAYGYPKAEITADKLPIWQQPLARFSVEGSNDWKVSILTSIDRGIRIEAGVGSGDGVTDETFDYETLSLPTPPSASAWYLIVRRRNWSGTGTSTLVAIRGTAEKKLPTRRDVPGSESDQPLALVRVTQKDRPVQEIVDLRCWASNGGVEVVDKLALDYLGTPGAEVKLGNDVWRFEHQGNGVWGWGTVATGATPTGSGWNLSGLLTKTITPTGSMVSAGFMCTYPPSSGPFLVTPQFQRALTLSNPGFLPKGDVFGQLLILSSANAVRADGTFNINSRGELHVRTLTVNYSMVAGDKFYISANWAV